MKLGILGNGQLARMLSLAAIPLGIETLCISSEKNPEGNGVTPEVSGYIENKEALIAFAKAVDVVTIETENIPLDVIRTVMEHTRFCPGIKAVEKSQDRLLEKDLFNQLKIKTAPYRNIESFEELKAAVKDFGMPCILKTRRMGYDGKGQYRIKSNDDVEAAWEALHGNTLLILEGFVNFLYECSFIAIRSRNGDITHYSPTHNVHEQGILYQSFTADIEPKALQFVVNHTEKLLNDLDYIGTIAIEFFVMPNNEVLANEFAPRVHNSGHWTIDGAVTSQFENHIRALFDLSLGETARWGDVAMFNCVGSMPPIEKVLAIPNTHYHDYGKEPRHNRKLGHVTLVDRHQKQFDKSSKELNELIQFNKQY